MSNYDDKQTLQNLLFLDANRYKKQITEVRIPLVKTLIAAIADTTKVLENVNKQATFQSGLFICCVASSGIEPESGASETLILSIVLRGHVKH